MGETGVARAAREYLIKKRGLIESVLRAARVGLARKEDIPECWSGWFEQWWIVFPVPDRLRGGQVIGLKGVAFDPERGGWKHDSEESKIVRNAGPAVLYDLTRTEPQDGPLLLTEGELDGLSAVAHGFNAATGTAGARTFKVEWAENIARL